MKELRNQKASNKPKQTNAEKKAAGYGKPTKDSPDSLVRINRLLAELGIGSRRSVEKLVVERRVRVDGKLVKELSEKFSRSAKVLVDGKHYQREKRALYLFHKPKRCVTTLSDPEGRRCISDYTGPLPQRVYPVGRLDYDVCGLILLTNDGELADSLMHPSFGVEREYLARVHGEVNSETGDMIRRGFRGRGMNFRVISFEVKPENENREKLVGAIKEDQSLVSLVVSEGKKHFVKELLKAAGHPVIELARVRFGNYKLGNLKPGGIKKV